MEQDIVVSLIALMVVCVIGALALEIFNLKRSLSVERQRIDELAGAIKRPDLSSTYVDETTKQQVKDLIKAGHEVEAVRLIRKVTNLDLARAKARANALAEE
ncbi:MAG: hypothetical protein ACOX4F_05610 [Atopobiaceae bacterium]|jgi:hypothetical protein